MAVVPLYGVFMHECCARGDLPEMHRVCREAEEYLRTYGDVSKALEELKAEIARLESLHA